MKCESCGHENDTDVKFCVKCGAQLSEATEITEEKETTGAEEAEVTETTPEEKESTEAKTENKDDANPEVKEAAPNAAGTKSIPIIKLLAVIVPVVLVMAVAIIIIASRLIIGGFSGTPVFKDSIMFVKYEDSVAVSANNNAKFTVEGEMWSSQLSIDSKKAALLTDYTDGVGGMLWFVTPSGSTKIAEDVLEYQLSDSGNGVAYLTDYDSQNDFAALYLYDTASKKKTRITDEAMYQSQDFYGFDFGFGKYGITGVCISPNGKSVAYISDYDRSSKEFTGYIKADGKSSVKLGNNMFALAISDGAKNIYYVKISGDSGGGSLYAKSGKNDNRIIPDLVYNDDYLRYFNLRYYINAFILNKDYSQIIFEIEGKSYISRNGSERSKISNSPIESLIMPRAAQQGFNINFVNIGDFKAINTLMVCNISSFADQLAKAGDGIYYINSKFESEKISGTTSSGYDATVSSDGKSLLYTSGSGTLIRIDPTNPDAESKDLGIKVQAFAASGDCKTVYYVNTDNELWCVKGNGKPSKISDDVSDEYLALSYNNNKLFFLVDYSERNGGELYYSNNGGKRTKISGASDVKNIISAPNNIFYMTVDSDLYRSNGGEKFALFQEGAEIEGFN